MSTRDRAHLLVLLTMLVGCSAPEPTEPKGHTGSSFSVKDFVKGMPKGRPDPGGWVEAYGAAEKFMKDRYGRSGDPNESYQPPTYDPETGKIKDGYFYTPQDPNAPQVPNSGLEDERARQAAAEAAARPSDYNDFGEQNASGTGNNDFLGGYDSQSGGGGGGGGDDDG